MTILFKSYQPIRTASYVWTAIRRAFPQELSETAKNLSITKDEMGMKQEVSFMSLGAVFDVEEKYLDMIQNDINVCFVWVESSLVSW